MSRPTLRVPFSYRPRTHLRLESNAAQEFRVGDSFTSFAQNGRCALYSPYCTCWMQCQQKRTILSWVDDPVDDTDVTQDDAHHVFHAVSCHTHICFLPDGSRSDESDGEESSGNVARHVDFHWSIH